MSMGLGEIGWPPQIFWSSTLSELLAAYRGYINREKRADMRFAHLTTWYANAHRDREQRPDPYIAADFFPSLPRPPEEDADEDIEDLDGE